MLSTPVLYSPAVRIEPTASILLSLYKLRELTSKAFMLCVLLDSLELILRTYNITMITTTMYDFLPELIFRFKKFFLSFYLTFLIIVSHIVFISMKKKQGQVNTY